MDARLAYALYKGLAGDTFSFAYSGAFHDEHTARLIALGEAAMEGEHAGRSARQRLAYVMVEAYQNIIRHRAVLPEALARGYGRSIFLLRCHGEAQQVVAVNPVLRTDLPVLEEAIHGLRGLDAAQLKERFLDKLSNEGPRARGGAGLGLIEMARRSGRELQYDMRDLGDAHVIFMLQVCLGQHPEIDHAVHMLAVLSGTIAQQDVLFYFKGVRNATANEAMMQLAEKDLDDRNDRADDRKRGFLSMTGLLDLLADPGAQSVVVMARSGDRYHLVAGTPMAAIRAKELGELIATINTWDEQTRRSKYRDLVLGREGPADPVLLALVDLARTSPEPLEWAVSQGPEGCFGAWRVVI